MISKELEITFHSLFVEARSKRHEYITLEHLLLALLDIPAVMEALRACSADLDALREHLAKHIAQHTPIAAGDREVDTQPTMGFQRTLQRAILHAQASGKEVTSIDVLVAIFGEHDSHAVYFLDHQGVDRLRVTRYISHGAVDSDYEDLAAPEMRQVILFQDQPLPAETMAQVVEDFLLLGREELAEVLGELARVGKALCGLYARETAEFVVEQIRAYAVKHRLPLRCEAALQARRPPSSPAQDPQK